MLAKEKLSKRKALQAMSGVPSSIICKGVILCGKKSQRNIVGPVLVVEGDVEGLVGDVALGVAAPASAMPQSPAALFLFAGIAPDAAPLQSKISARSDNKILIGKEFEYDSAPVPIPPAAPRFPA